MRYHALACDGDGTLLRRGRLARRTELTLRRLRAVGGKVILVTGEVRHDFAPLAGTGLFDCIIGENGAVLVCPEQTGVKTLSAAPSAALVRVLRKVVHPLHVGRVVLSTRRANRAAIQSCSRRANGRLACCVQPQGRDGAAGRHRQGDRFDGGIENVKGIASKGRGRRRCRERYCASPSLRFRRSRRRRRAGLERKCRLGDGLPRSSWRHRID